MINYLLDTDTCIYILNNRHPEVLKKLEKFEDQVGVSVITVSELFYGASKSKNPNRNKDILNAFLNRLSVLVYTSFVCIEYGDIRSYLEKKGEIIGANDLHIAAHARCDKLVLVTNNTREFKRVPNLKLENWRDKC
ncbi:hypothetical protein AB832_05040 [Flavobacteriaceae bacterium (ex Bugula neritina AB1)]|nr:hypothetical protein AB832_05040 [Flavobacteriaceae bacterium (ex Bugula neritina AB1)]